ncbi:MAG: hypothetical protein AWU57_351 [Marinobacter sp. T13-3]|nr:MAG: hypothetical protein AWU57_351 [Marinobacter sp. T13-3]
MHLHRLSIALLTALAVGLGGCTINTGNRADSTLNDDRPDTPPYIVNGVYQGSISNPGSKLTLFALNGNLQGIDTNGLLYGGKLETNRDDSYVASLTMYDKNGDFDGIAVTGSYHTNHYLNGWGKRVSGGDSELSLDYQQRASEQPASIEQISGQWQVGNLADDTTFTLTISPTGDLAGHSSNGCKIAGRLSAPDPSTNLYHTNLSFKHCGPTNGSYYGISARGATARGDLVTVLVSNDHRAYYLKLEAH